MQIPPAEKYQFDEFQLDAPRRRLLRGGVPITLNPKAFDMLLVLVRNCGKLLSKDDLFEMVWQNQIVEESNLTVNMSQIRKALGERASNPRFIITISGQGYRFLANLREVFDEDAEDAIIVHEHTRAEIVIEEIETKNDFQTLAVLPFKAHGKAENEYLGLGMADALITKLSGLRQLRVRPTSAVMKYGGAKPNRSRSRVARRIRYRRQRLANRRTTARDRPIRQRQNGSDRLGGKVRRIFHRHFRHSGFDFRARRRVSGSAAVKRRAPPFSQPRNGKSDGLSIVRARLVFYAPLHAEGHRRSRRVS